MSKEGTIKSQIEIYFYEKVARRASWWTAKISESEICWEKWELNCEFLPFVRNERGIEFPFCHILISIEKVKSRNMMESQLVSALQRIVILTQKTDHIPPITTNEANPFPYQVFLQYRLLIL